MKILKNCKKSTIHSREMGLKADEQNLKYDLKKGIDRKFARDQLSVIKIYFKESQITLCTNGKGEGGRSEQSVSERGISMSKT